MQWQNDAYQELNQGSHVTKVKVYLEMEYF